MKSVLGVAFLRALLRWCGAVAFCLPLRHRPHFGRRAVLMLLPLIALARVLNPLEQSATLWEQQAPLLLLYVSFFVLLGVMIYLCVEIDLRGALYCAVWSLLTAQTAYEGWRLLELVQELRGHPLDMTSHAVLLVQLLTGAAFYLAVCGLLARRLPYKGTYNIGPRQLASSFLIGILFMLQAAVLSNARTGYWPLSLIATMLIGQLYFLTLLYFQTELFKKSALEKEMNALNLLYERQRQAVSGGAAERADHQQALPRTEGADRGPA